MNVKKDVIEYFDSFGLNPPNEIITISNKLKLNYLFNSSAYQDFASILCGYYCLYYIRESDKGKSFYNICKPFSIINPLNNEKFIINYFNNIT